MVSLWERESFLHYDVIILGAGITGLSTAASLIEKNPKLNVLVLERGTLPSGASTKNAGFACFGSISELAQDLNTLGADGMTALVQRRWQGLQKTVTRLGEVNIGYENKGGFELLSDKNLYYADKVEELNDLLKDAFEKPVFAPAEDKLNQFGFGQTRQLIYNQYEGQLHTGKLMSALWQYCCEKGVRILTGTEVQSIEKSTGYEVRTNAHAFRAPTVAVCTNAFTPAIVKEKLDIKPGRGMVMLIQPKKPLKWEGTFHYDEGYFYFRDFEGQVIFGGGRNLDLASEETDAFGLNAKIEQRLMEDLREIILPNQDFEVTMKWSGIMAFGENKKPIVQQLENGIFLGVRLGGMGVAIGSLVGEELAEMIGRERL